MGVQGLLVLQGYCFLTTLETIATSFHAQASLIFLQKPKHHWALKENFASLQQDAPSLRKIRAKNP